MVQLFSSFFFRSCHLCAHAEEKISKRTYSTFSVKYKAISSATRSVFDALDLEGTDSVSSLYLLKILESNGLLRSDPRIKVFIQELEALGAVNENVALSLSEFDIATCTCATLVHTCVVYALCVCVVCMCCVYALCVCVVYAVYALCTRVLAHLCLLCCVMGWKGKKNLFA